MVRLKFFPIVMVFAGLVAAGSLLQAQTAQDSAANLPVKLVPEDHRPMPFPPGSMRFKNTFSVEFLAPDQMTERDREMEAGAESSIAERAGFADLEFNEGKWGYRQIACPALPNHLFLRFTRNNGVGDVSVFSVSIPRTSEGRVRIIPIQRRGYSLFSPAPINALTISAFNHIRGEENLPSNPDWLGTGLCYAALAGADPVAEPRTEASGRQKFYPSALNALKIPGEGGAQILFTDTSALPHPMEWTLTFDPKGRLLKATHLPAPQYPISPVPQSTGPLQGTPVPPTIQNVRGVPVAQAASSN
jgi:hypothetical protein